VVGILFCLFLGPILAFMGEVTKDEFEVLQQRPQEIALADLIKNGPGLNRHVTLTQFEAGGYVVEQTDGGTWKEVWIALYPAGLGSDADEEEIKVVFASKSINSKPMLRQVMQQRQVTGICSKSLRSSWGATLGPEMVKANDGAPLKSAWSIHAPRSPPSAQFVKYIFVSSYAAFGAALAIAGLVVAQGFFTSGRG
jgi:hypothetical protein